MTEGKFGDIIDKVRGQLETATKTLYTTSVRTRAMGRKLNNISALPQTEAEILLQLGERMPDTEEQTA
jgi:DNA recombination protein RmuC